MFLGIWPLKSSAKDKSMSSQNQEPSTKAYIEMPKAKIDGIKGGIIAIAVVTCIAVLLSLASINFAVITASN